MQIKIWRNPYDTGVKITTPKVIELHPGLTVLTGCNGAGKTTLIQNIKEEMQNEHIPYCIYDNMHNGGMSAISAILGGYNEYSGDSMETGITLWTASEGEAIKLNVSRHSTLYRDFLQSGHFKDSNYRMRQIFSKDSKEEDLKEKRRVFLFDATDSGMSIDAVIELKEMFNAILKDAKTDDLECYIIIAANEYEMCRNENCFDVNAGKYLTFTDYEAYRDFIIQSRVRKTKRLQKERAVYLKKQERTLAQYQKLKTKAQMDIAKIHEKAKSENRKLTYSENHQIGDIEYRLQNFARQHNLKISEK